MRNVCVFLFDVSGVMAQPWLEDGYECWTVDLQHPPAYKTGGLTRVGNLVKVHADLSMPWLCPVPRERIAFAFAFPPCDHLAVSGALWFKGKGLRRLASSVSMFATAAEFCDWSGAPYGIENPVSNIASHWRKPDHYFDPADFTGFELGDNYTKKTSLWVGGGFVMPDSFQVDGLPPADDRIHKAPPGPDRHNFRSRTPLGFARAVHLANRQRVLTGEPS